MPRENAATKARRYLGEGRLIVLQVKAGRPGYVRAVCRGDGQMHRQTYNGRWSCTCPALTDQCSHLTALRMVVAVDLEQDDR